MDDETRLPQFAVGDRVITNLPVYRRWWQLWRPRIVGYKRWSLAVTEARFQTLPIVFRQTTPSDSD